MHPTVTGQDGDVDSDDGAGGFDFISDRPVLDFVATVAERGTTHVDRLRDVKGLARWVAESGMVHNPVPLSRDDLERAKTVREAMFRLICAAIDGTPVLTADRQLVNLAAEHPRPVSRLAPTGQVTRHGDLDAVLAALAIDCIELFDGRDRDLLSWCADPHCTRPYIDRSHGHRRRWCGMKGCGDRAKATAYRRRRRSNGGSRRAAGTAEGPD